jgi:Sec7-like guanine-nucleotide exchange factor
MTQDLNNRSETESSGSGSGSDSDQDGSVFTTEQSSNSRADLALQKAENKKTKSLFAEALAKLNSTDKDDINAAHPHQ